jgi:hypothetical protein
MISASSDQLIKFIFLEIVIIGPVAGVIGFWMSRGRVGSLRKRPKL